MPMYNSSPLQITLAPSKIIQFYSSWIIYTCIPYEWICSKYDILEQVDILTFTILLKYQHDNAAGYLIKTESESFKDR